MEELTSQQVTDKILELTEQFSRHVFEHPDVLDNIPDKAVLVFLDPKDPDFNRASVERARALSHPDAGSLVYIEMHQQARLIETIEWQPRIVSPPIAA